jgi:hypothetical protein
MAPTHPIVTGRATQKIRTKAGRTKDNPVILSGAKDPYLLHVTVSSTGDRIQNASATCPNQMSITAVAERSFSAA